MYIMPQSEDEDRSESVEPDAMNVARPVLNGENQETYPQGNAPCPYPTRRHAWTSGCSATVRSVACLPSARLDREPVMLGMAMCCCVFLFTLKSLRRER